MTVLGPALTGVLVALTLLALAPRGRPARGIGTVVTRRVWPARRRSPVPGVAMEVVVTQVAGLLRSGLPPQRAWELVGGLRVEGDGVPDTDDLARRVAGGGRGRSSASGSEQARRQAAAVVAACRLAVEVGAPLAPVLESIVATLVASAEAEAERDAALAGPQTTARVLLWLPVVGALLGSALGADPVRLVLGGGPTALAPVAGIGLLVAGRAWTARLTARARVAGSPP